MNKIFKLLLLGNPEDHLIGKELISIDTPENKILKQHFLNLMLYAGPRSPSEVTAKTIQEFIDNHNIAFGELYWRFTDILYENYKEIRDKYRFNEICDKNLFEKEALDSLQILANE